MKVMKLFVPALAYLLTAAPAMAGGNRPEPYEPIDVQALIDSCKRNNDPGNQSDSLKVREMKAGDRGVCYVAAILHLMEPMFDPGEFTREDAERLLTKIHGPAFDFYAHVLTYHRKCPCGDDAEVAFRLAAQQPFEGILLGIGEIREDYSR